MRTLFQPLCTDYVTHLSTLLTVSQLELNRAIFQAEVIQSFIGIKIEQEK